MIDTLNDFLNCNVLGNQQVRRALRPLRQLAEETNVAIVLLRHLVKIASGHSLLRGGGSVGITAMARSQLKLYRHPDDPNLRVLLQDKSTLGPLSPSLMFEVVPVGNDACRLEWHGPCSLTVEDLERKGKGSPTLEAAEGSCSTSWPTVRRRPSGWSSRREVCAANGRWTRPRGTWGSRPSAKATERTTRPFGASERPLFMARVTPCKIAFCKEWAKGGTTDDMESQRYPYHPACLLFPRMNEAELRVLADNIKARGLDHDVILHEGNVLDGRNRYLACEIAGVEPRFVEWQGKGSPLEWVVGENLLRRHMSSSQRAVVALGLLPLLEEEAKGRQRLSPGRGKKVVKNVMPFRRAGKASRLPPG